MCKILHDQLWAYKFELSVKMGEWGGWLWGVKGLN